MPEDRDEVILILEPFKKFFENSKIEKIGHNLKFDLKVLKQYGINVKAPLFDTMIAHYLINPDMRHSMDVLAKTYLNYNSQPISDLIGKKVKIKKACETFLCMIKLNMR